MNCHNYKMFYVSLMVITKKKSCSRDTKDKEKRIKTYHYTKVIKSQRKTTRGKKNHKTGRVFYMETTYVF